MLANLLPAPGLPSCLGDAFPARRRRRGIGPLIAFALSFAGGETQSLAMDVRTASVTGVRKTSAKCTEGRSKR